jgi:hypothetical protein
VSIKLISVEIMIKLVNAIEQPEQMDSSVGISSVDIRRAFDSVSKRLIHSGCVRLGVPEDVVRWLQAMDEEALTIVRTPFTLEIHYADGIDGLWKAIQEGRLAAFMAERGTAQGDVTSPATWMCVFDILLSMLELARLPNHFYIRHDLIYLLSNRLRMLMIYSQLWRMSRDYNK